MLMSPQSRPPLSRIVARHRLTVVGEAATSARQPDALAAFRDQLATLGLTSLPSTLPVRSISRRARVKEQVYLPDWRSASVLRLRADSAAFLAAILPTHRWQHFHPAGKRSSRAAGGWRRAAMAARLVEAVADLYDGAEPGKRIAPPAAGPSRAAS